MPNGDDDQEQGPWLKYSGTEEQGPWQKYGAPPPPPPEVNLPGATPRLTKAVETGKAPNFSETSFEKERRPENQPGFWQSFGPGIFPQPEEIKRHKETGESYTSMRNRAMLNPPEPPGFHPFEDIESRRAHGRSLSYQAVALAGDVLPLGISPRQMEKSADIGNASGVAGQAAQGGLWVAAAPAAEGAGAIKRGVSRFLEPGRIEHGGENFFTALDTPAGKRGARAAKMKEDVRIATPDLAAIEKEAPAKVTMLLKRGKGAENFHELAEKIDARQDAMWEEGHTPGIERHGEMPSDSRRLVNAGRRVITQEARDAAPQEAAAAEKWLDENISRGRNLKSLDGLIREINDDMKGKDAVRYGPLQIRVRQAVVKEARQEVERLLTNAGEYGVKAVNRRWGALDNIKGRLQERAVQLARTEAKEGPIPDWVHLYTFMHPDLGISVGASIAAARALKGNPSTQLTKGLRQFGRTSLTAPYEAPAPPGWRIGPETNPARLLNAPPVQLPAPGTAETLHPEMFRQEPIAREPATNVQRGAGGRMQRVYEGVAREPGEQARFSDVFAGNLGPTPVKRPPPFERKENDERAIPTLANIEKQKKVKEEVPQTYDIKTADELVEDHPHETAWLAPDGKFHHVGDEHSVFKAPDLQPFTKRWEVQRENAIDKALNEGHIRVVNGDDGGEPVNVEIKGRPTAAQLSALSKIVKGTSKTIVYDMWDSTGKLKTIEQHEISWPDFLRDLDEAYPSERRTKLRDIEGPDFMRTTRAQELRGQLADPSLPDRDRAIIQAQLDDLIAHPFERTEKLDIGKVRAAQKKGKKK